MIGKRRLSYSLYKSRQVFCLLLFALPIEFLVRKRSFRWLTSCSVLDPLLEGSFQSFKFGVSVRPRFVDANLAQKKI